MAPTVITQVTETEFKTKNKRTVPHAIPFDKDEVPTVEEFQEWYDRWHSVFQAEGLLGPDGESDAEG